MKRFLKSIHRMLLNIFEKRKEINTVGDLVKKTPRDMMKVRNLGRNSLEEVLQKLKQLGVELFK